MLTYFKIKFSERLYNLKRSRNEKVNGKILFCLTDIYRYAKISRRFTYTLPFIGSFSLFNKFCLAYFS